MMTLNMDLLSLVKTEMISQEVALMASENKTEMQQFLKGAYHTAFDKKW